jgi:hypothetical protein
LYLPGISTIFQITVATVLQNWTELDQEKMRMCVIFAAFAQDIPLLTTDISQFP